MDESPAESVADLAALQSRMVSQSKEAMDAALNEGAGLVYITGHVGNWELMAMFVAESGYTIYTAANHFPWDWRFRPELTPDWRDPGNGVDIDEYLRRQAMSARDYPRFIERLRREFPQESFLVVRYGDHQPAFSAFCRGAPDHSWRRSASDHHLAAR